MTSTEVIKCPAFRLSGLGQLPGGNVCAETGLSGANMAKACPFREANIGECIVNLQVASMNTRNRINAIISAGKGSERNIIGNM